MPSHSSTEPGLMTGVQPVWLELSGGDSGGEPPVPIPNTEVKPASADGTWGANPWESRTLPDAKVRSKAVDHDGLRTRRGEL